MEGNVYLLNDELFERYVSKSEDMWIVYFYKREGEISKKFEPVLSRVADFLKDQIKVAKISMENNKTLELYNITEIPSLKIFPLGIKSGIENISTRKPEKIIMIALEKHEEYK